MKHSTRSVILSFGLALSLAACDQDSDDEARSRMVVFDGAEVAVELEEEPTLTYFVDGRGSTKYLFDQTSTAIDYSRFSFQCPTMPAPIPMDEYLQMFDDDFYEAEVWTLRRPSGAEQSFRLAAECETYCFEEWPNDCIEICVPDMA